MTTSLKHSRNVILTQGNNNNFALYKESALNKAITDFGDFGLFIELNEYVEQVRPKKADFADGDATDIEISEMFTTGMKVYFEKLQKFRMDKIKFYGYLLSTVSAESRIVIESDSLYISANESKDPLTLWRIIVRTHLGGITSQSIVVNSMKIRKDYYNVQMETGTDIVVHKKNFLYIAENYHVLKRLDMKDHEVNSEMAWHFFGSLPDKVYSEFKADVINRLNNKSMKEDIALDEMFNLAKSYTPLGKSAVVNKAIVPTQSVFAVRRGGDRPAESECESEDEDKGEFITQKKKSQAKKGKGAKLGKVSRPIETIQCFNCYKLGHYKSDCPSNTANDDITTVADGKVKDK